MECLMVLEFISDVIIPCLKDHSKTVKLMVLDSLHFQTGRMETPSKRDTLRVQNFLNENQFQKPSGRQDCVQNVQEMDVGQKRH